MIRAIIADDEEATAELLREVLERTSRVDVVGVAHDGVACLQLFEQLRPDALFLDIKMSQLSGIEVAESVLQTDNPPLIAFITNFDEYAVQAFALKAVDYVVKIGELSSFSERIAETVDRMDQALKQKSPMLDEMRELINHLSKQQLHPLQRKLPIRDVEQGTVRLLDPQDVLCIIRRDRRAMLVTRGNAYPTYYTMDGLEERLLNEGFFRANPGALINLRYIEHMVPNGDGSYDVFLKVGLSRRAEDVDNNFLKTPITVSRSRAKQLLQILNF